MKLTIKNGKKKYGDKVVLSDINLYFEMNNIYGLVGQNGSGKTQILKALAGYIKLTSGHVFQNGTEIRKRGNYIQDAGVLIENPQFISHYSLIKNLNAVRAMCQNKNDIDLKIWLNFYNITEFANIKYKNLSLGTKQKMGLIQAFMHSPTVLILDEPMNALDAKSVELTKNLIRKHKEKGIVILTSHVKGDIEELCDKTYYIADGKISLE